MYKYWLYIVVIYTFTKLVVHLLVIIEINHASSLVRQQPESVKQPYTKWRCTSYGTYQSLLITSWHPQNHQHLFTRVGTLMVATIYLQLIQN